MLDRLDLSLKLGKSEARASIAALRDMLRDTQQAVRAMRIPVVVLFEGGDASGKGDSIAQLVYPLDPRGFTVRSTHEPTEEDLARPFLWRFWKELPARGDFVFFDRSWYRPMLEDRVDEEGSAEEAKAVAGEIREHERALTEDGFVLVKIWLHVSKDERKRRLARAESDPWERWRLTQKDRRRRRSTKAYLRAAEEMLELTSTANAPWMLVEADDPSFRRVKVMRILEAALPRALAAERPRGGAAIASPAGAEAAAAAAAEGAAAELRARARTVRVEGGPNVLDAVDLTKKIAREEYEKRLDPLQKRLRDLGLECYRRRIPLVVVYEGWDAAGKGGNIKRLTQELDPRGYEVIPIAAPDAIERSRHYLWRFWNRLPRHGHLAVFDRSWYGRVLVERVEGFATPSEWRRAYEEINRFERHLTEFGSVVVKYWLHISPEEQLRRFEDRERTVHKMHKIGVDDWRNRLAWNDYREAVAEMLERTTTIAAPWTIVEAEDNLWARIKTLETLIGAVERRLESKRPR